jgi:hypothetical protein
MKIYKKFLKLNKEKRRVIKTKGYRFKNVEIKLHIYMII